MKIRSITVFTDLTLTEPEIGLAQAANFLHTASPAFNDGGFEVQTRRVASQPFPRILAPAGPGLVTAYAQRVQEFAESYGIDYLSLGPAHAADDPDFVDAIPEIIDASETLFCSISIADPGRGIDPALIWQTADVIKRLSILNDDGFGNLFLAAIANCPPGAPFFPVAYHETGQPTSFALALEAADVAVTAVENATSITDAQDRLRQAVSAQTAALTQIAKSLATQFNINFGGIDFSLAPYPDDAISLGGAMEGLGSSLGGAGAAAAAAVIMSALDSVQFKRAGFNGLMLPILEDSVLAKKASAGELSVTDLLLYSTLCSVGLDIIPLPGDISREALAGILLDVAAISLRLDKPLTARLMPIPGKAAGEDIGLEDFLYFAPGRVMAAPRGIDAQGLLAAESSIHIKPRHP